VQGAHKHYQLQQADLTCSSLDELTVYNIRRLFALKARTDTGYAATSRPADDMQLPPALQMTCSTCRVW
jgi:hypothetical protein